MSSADDNGPTIRVADRPGLGARLYRRRHILAFLAVCSIVALTVGLRLMRQHREELPRIAEEGRAEGLKALTAGEFDLAKDRLGRAADALESLGDPEAVSARQLADEAAILADRADKPLEDIVGDVAASREGAASFASSRQRGRSIVVDAHVTRPAADGQGPEIDYRIFAGTKVAQIDLTGLDLFEGRVLAPGDRLTFGARLDSIQLDARGHWIVGLEPSSGVLISTTEAWQALERLGWPSSELAGGEVSPDPGAAP